jgi:hypothetical protein
LEWFQHHWVSALFLSSTLITVLLLTMARWWWRRRSMRIVEESFREESELDLLPALDDRDRDALEFIRRRRKAVWELPESELGFGIEALSRQAMGMVTAMAEIYFPGVESPEYEATLMESLQLVRRVNNRLIRLAEITPFKILGSRRFSEYQRFYQVYRKINDNPLLQFLKGRPHLYRIARWALHIKNLGNPLYWAGKEISREGYFFMLRWFHMALVSQVGREAMRLYSGRRFQAEEDRDAALICHQLFALTQKWGGPSSEEWAALVKFVTNRPTLEPEAKLHILARWSQNRLPKGLNELHLQTDLGLHWRRQGLKLLAKAEPRSFELKELCIQEELDALDNCESESDASSMNGDD